LARFFAQPITCQRDTPARPAPTLHSPACPSIENSEEFGRKDLQTHAICDTTISVTHKSMSAEQKHVDLLAIFRVSNDSCPLICVPDPASRRPFHTRPF